MSHVDQPKASWDVVSRSDAKVTVSPNIKEDITALLMLEASTSSFKRLISRPPELVGAPSLFFSASTAQYVILTLVLNLIVVKEVSDTVQLVNEAFKCLCIYNLELRKSYLSFCSLMSSWDILAVEVTLEKLQPSESAFLELEGVEEQLDFLQIYLARLYTNLVVSLEAWTSSNLSFERSLLFWMS